MNLMRRNVIMCFSLIFVCLALVACTMKLKLVIFNNSASVVEVKLPKIHTECEYVKTVALKPHEVLETSWSYVYCNPEVGVAESRHWDLGPLRSIAEASEEDKERWILPSGFWGFATLVLQVNGDLRLYLVEARYRNALPVVTPSEQPDGFPINLSVSK